LSGLFQWLLDTTDKMAYSLDPAASQGFLLFAGDTSYLEQVFWLVYYDANTYWSMSFYHLQ
jgi:hypothetical protein